MAAIGFMILGAGILTAWSGFNKVIVFDLLRTFIGAPTAARTSSGGAA